MSACPHKKLRGGFIEVLHAADCHPETGLCPCGKDYADECVRPGPTQNGVEYKEFRGVLYGRLDASLDPQ